MGDIKFISKYGYKMIAIFGILLLLSIIIDFWVCFFALLFIASLFLYRNPERVENIDDKRAIYSPIDGKISDIELTEEEMKISISNSVLDVGQIRTPSDVELIDIEAKKGLFLCTYIKSSNFLNEKVIYKFKNRLIEYKMVLIGGSLARKVYFERFESLKATRRVGFFIEGKVVLYLPKNIRLTISKDDKVRACEALGFIE